MRCGGTDLDAPMLLAAVVVRFVCFSDTPIVRVNKFTIRNSVAKKFIVCWVYMILRLDDFETAAEVSLSLLSKVSGAQSILLTVP